jgi:hypothetical protein
MLLVMDMHTSRRTIHTITCRYYVSKADRVDKYGSSWWSSHLEPAAMRRMHNMMTTTHCDVCRSYAVMIGKE